MRYLGNKTKMLERIAACVDELHLEGGTFCDLFAGSACVGDYFKDRFTIIANDFMTYSAVFARAKLYNDATPAFQHFAEVYHTDPFTYLNQYPFAYEPTYFVTNQYSPRGGRQFFSERNAIKIDGMRLKIEQLYGDNILSKPEYYYLLASLLESVLGRSNTSGTYEAFLKQWDCRALKDFVLSPFEMFAMVRHSNQNVVYNEDSNRLARRIAGDIVYIDPPYTTTEYSSAYHVLETIARYDAPELRGLTGRRAVNDKKSEYNRRARVLTAFEDLFRQLQFKYILVSYSNQSLIPLQELTALCEKFAVDGRVTVRRYPYREYKNIRESKKADELFEVLLLFEKNNEIRKSPLNYSGSKDLLVGDIILRLPAHISQFVDVMGGAFNVGANVVATDKVVYNDYNRYIVEIIRLLLESNRDELVASVRALVAQHGLSKGDKAAYTAFRTLYNEQPDPLKLFVLTMFCYQNQLRFNAAQKMNTPVGNCGFNETIVERILHFVPKTAHVEIHNSDFRSFDYDAYDKDALFYFDPPYFITSATYNDGKRGMLGWSAILENELLQTLSRLDEKGYRFLLSNVIYHKDKENSILKNWIETHNYKVEALQGYTRKELLIKNY